MLPKLFFLHFEGTSFVAEDDEGKLVAFLIGFLSQTDPDGGLHPLRRRRAGAAWLRARPLALRALLRGRAWRRPDARPLRHLAREQGVGRVPRVARLRRRERRQGLRRPGRGPRPVREAARRDPVVELDDMTSDGSRTIGCMAKVIVQHVCSECGTTTGRWLGKCPGCGAFGSLVEELSGQATPAQGKGGVARAPARLGEVRSEEAARIGTGVAGARPRPRRRHRARLARARRGRAGRREVDAAAGRSRQRLACRPPGAARHGRGVGGAGQAARRPARGRRSRSRSWPRPSSSPSARRSRRSVPTCA